MDELERAVGMLCQYRAEISPYRVMLAAHKIRKAEAFKGKTAVWLRGEILEKMEKMSSGQQEAQD